MSATQIDMKFSAVVEKPENLPAWLQSLSEATGKAEYELVTSMLEGEMYAAGTEFIKKHPELFRPGTSLA